MKKQIRTIDKIVKFVLAFVGMIIEFPVLAMKYILGLIWVAYTFIRGRNFKVVFSRLNKGVIKDVEWLIGDFKFNIF
jgi:hypothetical protein